MSPADEKVKGKLEFLRQHEVNDLERDKIRMKMIMMGDFLKEKVRTLQVASTASMANSGFFKSQLIPTKLWNTI